MPLFVYVVQVEKLHCSIPVGINCHEIMVETNYPSSVRTGCGFVRVCNYLTPLTSISYIKCFAQDGQIVSMKDGLCMTLVDGDT